VKERFSIQIPPSLPFKFVHIPKKRDPSEFKRLTLIAESIDTIKLAWNALHQFTPHVFVDTTGCAFTFLVAKLAGCKIVAYVHYPTVSTVSSNCKDVMHHFDVCACVCIEDHLLKSFL
jgi:alpha-1,2-mannosyltransferase